MKKLNYYLLIGLTLVALGCKKHGPDSPGAKTVAVVSVSVDPGTLSMVAGKTGTLTATVLPAEATDKSVAWSTSDAAVATVSSAGVVTAVAAGSATITVTTTDGGKKASCSVTVTPAHIDVSSVAIEPAELKVELTKTATLTATVLPADASDPSVSWSSSDPSVATVSAEGVVTGVALGATTVTVKTNEGGKTATCTVTVVERTDIIRYRTFDGKPLTPNSYSTIGMPVWNTYEDGWGVMTFDHSLTTLGNRIFYNCNLLQEMILPATVTGVGEECFRGCTSLESITLPSSLTTVGAEAFYNCYSLKKIDFPGTLASVGTGAFSRCSSLAAFTSSQASSDGRCLLLDGSLVAFAPAGLTEYTLPSDVTAIEASAMKYCAELQSLTIPTSVTAIGEYAFLNCSALTVVTLPATTPPALADKNAFDGTASLLRIYVPASAVSAYKTADGWKNLGSRIQAIPE